MIFSPMALGGSSPPRWTNAKSNYFNAVNTSINFGQPTDVINVSLTQSEMSIGLWFRTTDAGSSLFSVTDGTTRHIRLYNNAGLPTGYFGGVQVSSTGTFNDGLWKFFMWVSKPGANNAKIYVNGVQTGQGTAGNTILACDMMVGARRVTGNTGITSFFSGNIDELTIWNTAFSASEVVSLYNAGVPFDPTIHSRAQNLIHYYRFGDGDISPVIKDRAGTGINSGTITNSTFDSFVP